MLTNLHSSTGSGPPGPVKPPGNSRRGPPGHEPPSHASENQFMLHFATTNEPVKENAPSCQILQNESWHTLDGLALSIGSDRSARFRQRSASRLTGLEGLRHCALSRQPLLSSNTSRFICEYRRSGRPIGMECLRHCASTRQPLLSPNPGGSSYVHRRPASRLTGMECLRHCASTRQPTFLKNMPNEQI